MELIHNLTVRHNFYLSPSSCTCEWLLTSLPATASIVILPFLLFAHNSDPTQTGHVSKAQFKQEKIELLEAEKSRIQRELDELYSH